MNNLGLNVFVATIGIESGPSFVEGIKAVGPTIFLAGVVATDRAYPVWIMAWQKGVQVQSRHYSRMLRRLAHQHCFSWRCSEHSRQHCAGNRIYGDLCRKQSVAGCVGRSFGDCFDLAVLLSCFAITGKCCIFVPNSTADD